MNDEPKYCVNCQHFNGVGRMAGVGFCMHSAVSVFVEPNIVWGKQSPIAADAEKTRSVNGKCGPDGILFDPIGTK